MDPPSRRSTASWVLYDMANTVFSFAVVSLYFPLYLKDDVGLKDSAFAVALSVSMAVMLLVSPTLGALSDRARRRIPFLIASTVACVAATAPLGFVEWRAALALFGVANVAFLSGLVFYDALLPVVSTPQNRGRVGAIGVGVGYLGSLVGLGVGRLILSGHEERDAWVFLAAALMFLLLAIPAFVWVREPKRETPPLRAREAVAVSKATFANLARLLRGREDPEIGRFLLARVFYSDAVNTMIFFMGIYVTSELEMSDEDAGLVLLAGIVGAIIAAPLWGVWVDRRGPLAILRVVLGCWMVGLAAVAALPLTGLPGTTFYGLAVWMGACLGGTWAADRPLMIQLSPPERIGEFYGYYGMVGRFSAIVGPLVWALVVDRLGWGRPAAVASLLVFVALGLVLLRRVTDKGNHGTIGVAAAKVDA